MGLFDKIKDNAKTISIKAIESTREYEDEEPNASTKPITEAPTSVASNELAATTKPAKPTIKAAVEEVKVTEILADVEKTLESDQPKIVEEPSEDADIFEVAYEPTPEPATPIPTPSPKPVKIELPKPVITMPQKPTIEKTDKLVPKETFKLKISEESVSEVTPQKEKQDEYIPYYKMDMGKLTSSSRSIEVEKSLEPTKPGINDDIKPVKIIDPERRAILSRERTAIIELANQRRLEGKTALYTTSHLNFKTRVFINRIEYSGTFGKNILPIEQVAWIRLRHGGTGVMLETTKDKKVVMVVNPKDRLAFADAVMKMQSLIPKVRRLKDDKTVRLDVLDQVTEDVDDIERIAKLYKRGLITKAEYELKKKQILNI